MIISDDRVYSYYGEALKKNLSEKYECMETVIPHGDRQKHLKPFRVYTVLFWKQRFPEQI